MEPGIQFWPVEMSEAATGMKARVPRLRFPEFRSAPAWQAKPLAELCGRITNGSANAQDHEEGGLYPLFDRSEVIKRSNRFIFDAEVVILPGEGMRLVPRYFSGKFNLHQRAYALMEHRGSARFVYYALDHYNARLLCNAVKSTVPSLRLPIIEQFVVPTPNRGEQQKIADCLSSLDDLIAAHADKLAALKQHKQGLLEQLFPCEGETVPRLRFPEFRRAPDWQPTTVGAVCAVLQGYGFPLTLQGKRSGRYPFCKVSDISRAFDDCGGLLCTAANYVDDADVATLRAATLPVGSTVFAKIGEALRLNRRALTTVACLVDNNATGLKMKASLGSDYFLFVLSQRIDMNQYCGGAVPSISKSTLENIPITVPKPDEQQRIADAFASVDTLITAQSDRLAALKQHKQGLLQQLFPVMDETAP